VKWKRPRAQSKGLLSRLWYPLRRIWYLPSSHQLR